MVGLARRGDRRAIPHVLEELKRADVLMLAIEAAEHLGSPVFASDLDRLHQAAPEDKRIFRALLRCRAADD